MKLRSSIFVLVFLLFSPLEAEDLWNDIINAHPVLSSANADQLPHCGFHILLEAYQSHQPDILEKIYQYGSELQQKSYNTFVSPSGHFTITYEDSGAHAIPIYDRDQNGIPDYLEFVANAFDRAWRTEIDTLGFKPPPDFNGQAKVTYDIDCQNLSGQRLYGSTIFFLNEEISALPGNNYPSHIQLSTDFSFVNYPGVTDPIVRDSMAIAVTAAHEFNHALQLGYNIWDANPDPNFFEVTDRWFIENSATYMEEVVADEVNDYYFYLPSFFATMDRGITTEFPSNRIYGQIILNIMLGQLYGKSITREVWEEIVNQPALPALNKVLRKKGSDFQREIHRLAEWMFFSGDKYSIAGRFFPEAMNYPGPKFHASSEFSTGLQEIDEGQLPPFSFQYLKTVISADNNLNIYLVPQNTQSAWSGSYFGFLDPFAFGFPAKTYSQVPLESIVASDDTLFSAVVAGNWNEGQPDSLIQYSLFLKEYPGDIETDILVYPSLIKPEQNVENITFTNVPSDSRIEIFSSTGHHIKTIYPRFSNTTIFWNLKTSSGNFVGSGVYVYAIVSPNSTQKGKIMVIR